MGNKAIDLEVKSRKGKSYGRQAMWDAMREMREFTRIDIAKASDRDTRSVVEYLQRLMAANIIEEIGKKVSPKSNSPSHQRIVYRLLQDFGRDAPRLHKDGSFILEAREQMWRTMKMLSHFEVNELAMHASTDECQVSPIDAKDYCRHLCKAAYLVVLQESTHNKKKRYKLLPSMNTGLHAPKVQRTKCVYDLNLQKIMWHEEIEP